MAFDPKLLQPGDCLLYRPGSLLGFWIAVKTWNWISHVEVYAGEGQSYAARVHGVDYYPLDLERLAYVLRPRQYVWSYGRFDGKKADKWFLLNAKGQEYDFLGLLCFYLAAKHGSMKRMFCSELATRLYRAGDFHPFSPDYDADKVAPAQFLQTFAFNKIYQYKQD